MKCKCITEEKPFIVFDHSKANELMRAGYHAIGVRPDNKNKDSFVFLFEREAGLIPYFYSI